MPNHIIVDREGLPPGQQDPEGFKEDEDFVELGGIQVSRVLIAFKLASAALHGQQLFSSCEGSHLHERKHVGSSPLSSIQVACLWLKMLSFSQI